MKKFLQKIKSGLKKAFNAIKGHIGKIPIIVFYSVIAIYGLSSCLPREPTTASAMGGDNLAVYAVAPTSLYAGKAFVLETFFVEFQVREGAITNYMPAFWSLTGDNGVKNRRWARRQFTNGSVTFSTALFTPTSTGSMDAQWSSTSPVWTYTPATPDFGVSDEYIIDGYYTHVTPLTVTTAFYTAGSIGWKFYGRVGDSSVTFLLGELVMNLGKWQSNGITASPVQTSNLSSLVAVSTLDYETGYIDGLIDGRNETDTFINPFESLASFIDELLTVSIAPGISLGLILSMALGLILLGVVIKVFMGG